MKVRIEGVMNPCNFIGCSFEERAGFQKIHIKVTADMDGVRKAEKEARLQETESLTDNIKANTTINVAIEE